MASGLPSPPDVNQTAGKSNIMTKMEQLSPEEKVVMKECESEAIFYRCIPLACGAMLGTFYLIRTGKWAPHPKYGPVPKMIGAALPMYFFGKVSYLDECRQKILTKIPHSNLAAQIRGFHDKRDTGSFQQNFPKVDNDSFPAARGSEFQEEQQQQPDFDDRLQPATEGDETSKEKPNSMMTYEERRRKNREEYEKSKQQYEDAFKKRFDRRAQPPPAAPPQEAPDSGGFGELPAQPEPPQAPRRKKRTNMWGDEIDD